MLAKECIKTLLSNAGVVNVKFVVLSCFRLLDDLDSKRKRDSEKLILESESKWKTNAVPMLNFIYTSTQVLFNVYYFLKLFSNQIAL